MVAAFDDEFAEMPQKIKSTRGLRYFMSVDFLIRDFPIAIA